ncbi:hypothetical protein OL548_11235 [Lysinibacillus sp. MHQ-1]|nr:hypothetical protein OL548_11235 [Lysinibacillus sp. MHQ-1]
MCHAEETKTEIVEATSRRTRKKNQLPNICPSLFEGLFFILEELRDNIKEMHLFGYTQPLSHYFLFIL